MEDKLSNTASDHSENSGRKYPNHKDVKRKLSFINKKISDLQHQRKSAYKNSSKVKKAIHCQVNQIVKCLKARERKLWADVDEAYLCQDENISDQLTKLQSIYTHCQTLFDHLDGNNGNFSALDNIYSVYSDVNLGEKPHAKALEFLSQLDHMKEMALSFGYLNGDFVKKEEVICIDEKFSCLSKMPDPLVGKKEQFDTTCLETYKDTNSEDTFEIIDMIEDMSCDELDSFKAEQENFGNNGQSDIKVNPAFEDITKSHKESNNFESVQKEIKSNFNPEEEWKQIIELKNKMASFNGIIPNFENKSKGCEIKNYENAEKNCKQYANSSTEFVSCFLNRNSSNDKSCIKDFKQRKYVPVREADNWLCDRNVQSDALNMAKYFEKISIRVNSKLSPADTVKKAFTSYLTKEGNDKWLLKN